MRICFYIAFILFLLGFIGTGSGNRHVTIIFLLGLLFLTCGFIQLPECSDKIEWSIEHPRVYQISEICAPELQEIIWYFDKTHQPINNLDFTHRFEYNPTQKALQALVHTYPYKKQFLDDYEQNKDACIDFNETWTQSAGKLIHKELRSDSVRQEWSKKLSTDETGPIRISGNFYYPPGGYREWHTNRTDLPGWRLYYVKTFEPQKSGFRYVDPQTKQMHTVMDQNGMFNLFNLKDPDGSLWHSVFSKTHRFSLGFHISDEYAQKLIQRQNNL